MTRLVNADELKEMGATCFARRNENGKLEAIISIDNAPTVDTDEIYKKGYHAGFFATHGEHERPQGKLKEYKPLELDYNVQCAVENLKTAYGSNDAEKYAKAFTEAEEQIISAICHHGYTVCKQPQGEWIFKKFDEETGISNSDWCPFCGKAKAQVYDKFCGNCGAQLRKEKVND